MRGGRRRFDFEESYSVHLKELGVGGVRGSSV